MCRTLETKKVPSMPKHAYQIVLTTCPDETIAKKIAEELVAAGFAACVNILPSMQSVYRWQGKIESAQENLLLIKSETEKFDAIQRQICARHPYELPEIIAVPIVDGLQGYLSWLSNPNED